MDYIRTGYKTTMRLWQGDPTEVPVRWFRANSRAGVFNAPHAFTSAQWRRGHLSQRQDIGPLEVGETTLAFGQYDRGRNDLQYRGKTFCGRPEAFLAGGAVGVDAPILTLPDGSSPCCFEANPLAPPFLTPLPDPKV